MAYQCGLSESLTPVLGGIPYADSAEAADLAISISCVHVDADYELREFFMEVGGPAPVWCPPVELAPPEYPCRHFRSSTTPSMCGPRSVCLGCLCVNLSLLLAPPILSYSLLFSLPPISLDRDMDRYRDVSFSFAQLCGTSECEIELA